MANIQFPGLGRLAQLGSRMAAMERMRLGRTEGYLNPVPTPPGPVQAPFNQPEAPLGNPVGQQNDISLPPMTAGQAPEPAQAPAKPVLPSPPASSMIRDVKRQRFAF